MSLYRCRYLDRTFNVFEVQGLACENDAEAIVMARRMSANTGAAGFGAPQLYLQRSQGRCLRRGRTPRLGRGLTIRREMGSNSFCRVCQILSE
jgi:hypothetical protein